MTIQSISLPLRVVPGLLRLPSPTCLLLSLTLLLTGCAGPDRHADHHQAMRPLFDGHTLAGWERRGGTAQYRVEDGMIVGRTVEGSPNTFLCTTRDYADFILELEVMCDIPLNSGIQIRSHVYEEDTPQASDPNRIREAGEIYGYQCEIVQQSRGTAGNFWDEGRFTKWHDDFSDNPAAADAFKDGQWNHYRIVAQGNHIRSWLNGVPAADFHDDTDATGFIGLQVHSIPRGEGPYEVRWKNILLRELERGETAL